MELELDYQDVLAKFERWLRLERGLAERSVQTEVWHAAVFMRWLRRQLTSRWPIWRPAPWFGL